MAVSSKDLDRIFNSSSDKVDDDELASLYEKTETNEKNTDSDEDLTEEESEMLSTGSGNSFAPKSKKKKSKDDGNIGDFDTVIETDEDSDMCEEEEVESKKDFRIPFEFDDDDDDDDNNCLQDKAKIETPVAKEEKPMAKEEPEDLDSEEDLEDKKESPKKKLSPEEEPDYGDEAEEDKAVQNQLMKVCKDPRYLEDPQYLLFYKEKLRAVKFLESALTHINYKKLEKELEMMHLRVDEEKPMSLDQFNQKIEKVQALRTRLTKIRSISTRDYVLRKRVVRLLEECLNKQSSERSNDKRMGEVQIHMADMEYHLAMSEAFYRDVEQIMENISCAHEALSRQITCLQERNKEISRGGEPFMESNNDQKWDSISHKEKKSGYKRWDEVC